MSVPVISVISSPNNPAAAPNNVQWVFACTNPNTSPGSTSGPMVQLICQSVLDGTIFSQAYATSAAATMTAFYTANHVALAALGITLTNPSSAVLTFVGPSGFQYSIVSAGTGGTLTPSSVTATSVTYTLASITAGAVSFIVLGTAYPPLVIQPSPADGNFYVDISDYIQERLASKLESVMSHSLDIADYEQIGSTVNAYLNMFAVVQTTQGYNASYPVVGTNTGGGTFPTLNITTDLTTSNDVIYCINAALQYTDPQAIDPYYVANTSGAAFLSRSPNSQIIGLNDSATLHIYHYGSLSADLNKLLISRYSRQGVFIDTTTVTISGASTNGVHQFGIGPRQLNVGGTVEIDNTIGYYTVTVQNSSSVAMTETRIFVVDRLTVSGSLQDFRAQNRLFWLNSLGGIDSYTFNARYVEKQNNEIHQYQKYLPAGYSVGDRGLATSWVKSVIPFDLETGFLTLEEYRWLSEVLTSPSVYMQDFQYTPQANANAPLVPVVVTSKASIAQDTDEPLPFLSFSLQFANTKVTQMG